MSVNAPMDEQPLIGIDDGRVSLCSRHSSEPIQRRDDVLSRILRAKWYWLYFFVSLGIVVPCAVWDVVEAFTWKSWFTLEVTWVTLLLLNYGHAPDLVLLSTTLVLRVSGVISDDEAWSGFSSMNVLAIGALFVVAKSVEEAGTVEILVGHCLGRPKSAWIAVLRLCVPVCLVSAFVNDTPVVAMMLPVVEAWAIQIRQPVSRFLMPLSFSALLGGMCTLIGTSTNVILADLVAKDEDSHVHMKFFLCTPVAACVAAVAVVYMSLFSSRFLSANLSETTMPKTHTRGVMYSVDIVVSNTGHGRTLEEIGVSGLFGVKTQKESSAILTRGERFTIHCCAESLAQLRRYDSLGVMPVSQLTLTLGAGRRHRCLVEVVLDSESPLIGSTVGTVDTKRLYSSGIFAAKSGTAPLSAQDTLLPGHALIMEAPVTFCKVWGQMGHFVVTRAIPGSQPPRRDTSKDVARKFFAGLVLLLMVLVVAWEIESLFVSVVVASLLLIAAQCVTADQGFAAIKGRIILAIIFSYGLGKAFSKTNIADTFAKGLVHCGSGAGPVGLLLLIFFATSSLSNIVSNQATVILLYPMVKSLKAPGVTLTQLIVVLVMGASSAFLTPTAYQTNLMVWEPGGYKFSDFTRFGTPLTLLVGIVTAITTHFFI